MYTYLARVKMQEDLNLLLVVQITTAHIEQMMKMIQNKLMLVSLQRVRLLEILVRSENKLLHLINIRICSWTSSTGSNQQQLKSNRYNMSIYC